MQYVLRMWWSCVWLICGVQIAWSAPRYVAYDLGDAVPRNLNDAGLSTGVAFGVAGTPQGAVRLQRGQPPFFIGTLTPPPFGGSQANAIGPQGAIVGSGNGEGFGSHAFIWTEAQGMQDLGTLGGVQDRFSTAVAINRAGTIVGVGVGDELEGKPLVWIAGLPMALSVPNIQGAALAISEYGDIAGEVQIPNGGAHATLWPIGGGRIDLHPPGEGGTSIALAMTADRLIIGQYDSLGFRWSPATGMQRLPLLPGDVSSQAIDVNSAGVIVGQGFPPEPCPRCAPPPHAVLWEAGGPVDLNTQLDTPGWVLYAATGINSQGWIVGLGVHDGNSRAFLLQPIPVVPTPVVALVQEVHGDFNGDGWEDLAGIDAATRIWVCNAGVPLCTTVAGYGVQIVAADLDHNGIDDLAVLAVDNTIWIRLNNGDSHWDRVEGWLTQMVAGNFFGDGQQHLAGLATDGGIWVSAQLIRTGRASYWGNWRHLPGSLQTMIAGDFTGVGRDQLSGVAYDTSLWFAADVRPLEATGWQQLPGYLVTMETVPGTPDAMQGLAYDSSAWCAPALGAWQPCPGGTLMALR